MGRRPTDLTGRRFGFLTVIEFSGRTDTDKVRLYKCFCDCGKEILVRSANLTNKTTISCGCFKKHNTQRQMVGKRFGKLLVVGEKEVEIRTGRFVVKCECRCDCGSITYHRSYHLKSGKITNCGCLLTKLKSERAKQHIYLPKTLPIPDAGAMKHAVFLAYKNSARKKGIPFTLGEEEFIFLTAQRCFYCGSGPTNIKKNKHTGDDYHYNGVDRIKSQKGYVPGNVVTSCFFCNVAKNIQLQEDFYMRILRVIKYKNLIENYKEFYDSLPKEN